MIARWALAASMAVILLGAVRAARAEDDGRLAAALAAKARVDYARALVEIDRALEAGDLSVAETRAALLLRGELLAALDRSAEAIDTFAELLAVDGGARLEPGLAPRVIAAFDEAAGRPRSPVTVSCEIDGTGKLAVSLHPGSSERARLVRVERAVPGSPRRIRDQVTPPSEIVLPRAAAEIACFAIDQRGNALASGPDWDRPLTWSPPPAAGGGEVVTPAPVDGEPARPLWRSPWLWGGAAVAVAGAGVTFNWLAQRDQSRLDELSDDSGSHEYVEARDVLERGRSRTRWARGLYIGAGVLAAAAVTCALLPSATARRSARRPGPSLTVGPLAVGLRVDF